MSSRKTVSPVMIFTTSCIVSGLALGGLLMQSQSSSLYKPSVDLAFVKDLSAAKKAGRGGDWSNAKRLLELHAKLDNPHAKLEYALLHQNGWGVNRDLEAARILLLQAVQYNFPERGRAAFELARVYRLSRGPDCHRIAFEWFTKAEAWGYKKANAELGKAHARGLGVPIDYDLAISRYSKAIDGGSAAAIVPLFETALTQQKDGNADAARGVLLANKYLPMLELEATRGNRVAARSLGRIHTRGLFVKPNQDRAVKWFALAASRGDAVAMHDLALLGLSGKQPKFELSKAVTFLNDSVELGYPAAMTALGRLYLVEPSIRDVSKALKYLELGATAGHAGSMAELSKLHFEGKLVPQDIPLAKKLARQGALQNHLGSKKLLLKIDQFAKSKKAEAKPYQEAMKG